MNSLDTLAAEIRARCISGHDWFLPAKWKDVPEPAKLAWRKRAEMELETRMEGRK